MAKIPFDIKYRPQIESGEYKVETKNGMSARIICWDAKASNRSDIIALVGGTLGSENIQRYNLEGHLIADSTHRGDKDLIIDNQQESSEFEKVLQDFAFECAYSSEASQFIIKRWKDDILNAAEEELAKEESTNQGEGDIVYVLTMVRRQGKNEITSIFATVEDAISFGKALIRKYPEEYVDFHVVNWIVLK